MARAYSPNMLLERIMDYTDKFDPKGPFSTILIAPLEAFNREMVLTRR